MLHAARTRCRADADLDLSQDGVLPGGEPHVAGQRQFAARPAGPAADLRDRHDRQLAELVPQHAQRRIVRPARLGRLGGVLRDLGQIDVRHEVLRVGALQHHDPGVLAGFHLAEQPHQVAHQFGPDQVHRRRVNHHTQHALVALGDAQRTVRLDHTRLLPRVQQRIVIRKAGAHSTSGRSG